jgi:dethiobiotin synthetase
MRVVVLGTGTDVGKTYVTTCLARGLRERGSVLALKPVESGVVAGQSGDAGAIAEGAGHAPILSPWRFARGVSPHLAAREAGVQIAIAEVAKWVLDQERLAGATTTLVELAGGAFSPLAPGSTNVELARALEPALWLLVAPDSLGVLHDVSATQRALPRMPDAVVLSSARVPDASSGSNADELAALAIAQVLEVVPRDATACSRTVEWLLRHTSYKSGTK